MVSAEAARYLARDFEPGAAPAGAAVRGLEGEEP